MPRAFCICYLKSERQGKKLLAVPRSIYHVI
jgi:hypothetical protein